MSTLAMEQGAKTLSVFTELEMQAPDALLNLITLYRTDRRLGKIDLGVGVFRDDTGVTPVMRAVKAAEATLLAEQTSKSYLGAEGDPIYNDLLARIALGERRAGSERLTGVQTPGGTGALRLGAELLARANCDATIWLGAPTWPNHSPIFRDAGLRIAEHRFYDPLSGRIDFDGMVADLRGARRGDALLLQGCCHNPTGAKFTPNEWQTLAHVCTERGLIPFIDLAYQGLGDGLDEDATSTRCLLDAVPDALVAYSCDKNFGLYRERVGALWIQAASAHAVDLARGQILSIARGMWSMPPDHGAAVVRVILESPALAADWRAELGLMRTRINDLRAALAAAHPALSAIADQRGMFAVLPISPGAVAAMREQDGIYMAGNGRISLAGLRLDTISRFVASLSPHLV